MIQQISEMSISDQKIADIQSEIPSVKLTYEQKAIMKQILEDPNKDNAER